VTRQPIYRAPDQRRRDDELTGCASLDALDRRLRDEFERARRYSLHFSLVVIDIDQLRDINDRLGHAAGDRVLGEIGAILQREIRAPTRGALRRRRVRLRAARDRRRRRAPFRRAAAAVFTRHTFADLGPAKSPGVSAGVIAYPHSEALRPEDLFTLAEGALQKAKTGAPDRIAVVGEN